MDAVPGYTNKTWFKIPSTRSRRSGSVVYTGQCAELCGRNHANMFARVIGLPLDEYKAWYDGKAAADQDARRRRRQAARRAQQAAVETQTVGGARVAATDRRPRRPRAPRPQIIAHEVERRRPRLDVVAHDDRSQEDRDHVPLHGPRLLRARRRRGAADADPARRAGQHVPDAREVQPDPHDARDDDDLPGRRAGLGGLRELPGAADDRRARRRLPAPERVVVLDVPVRRPGAVRVDVLHAAGGRLVLLRAAVAEAVLAHQRPGGVDLHGPPHRPVVDPRRDQLHRHDPQHARARHGLGPHAAVRVDDPDLRVPDRRSR